MSVNRLMENQVRKAVQASLELEATERLLDAGPEILKAAIHDIAPVARAQMLAAFASSGIRSRSGELASAIGRATVSLTRSGIRISLPPGMSDRFYKKAAALNYGAPTRGIPEREYIRVNKGELRTMFIKSANTRLRQRAK